jgi:3-mercaptopyruvate sulfurtransferase SseA
MSSKSSVRNAYFVMIVAGLAVLALVGWALQRSFQAPVSSNLPVSETAATPRPAITTDEHAQTPEKAAVPRITAEELQRRIKNGEVTVIDVRSAADYRMGHIPGSLHIPLASIESQISYLPKAKPIVTYCT